MSFEIFGCARDAIEGVFRETQKNILIREYCSESFGYVNMVDAYYRSVNENAILIFLIILITYPILFMSIATVADKYLSSGMQDLAKRLNLSPTLAAVTLIAFANGAPDVLAAFSSAGKDNGAFISVGALLGAFIFSTCLVVSNVAKNAKGDVQLPRRAVQKELGFYLLAVLTIIIFGLIKSSGWPFVGVYLTLYVLYIIATLYLENQAGKEEQKEDIENNQAPLNSSQGDGPEKLPGDEEDGDKPKGLIQQLNNELIEEEDSFFQTLVGLPLKGLGLFTICYLDNPLVSTPAKYLIMVSSTVFTFFTLELMDASIVTLAVIGACVAAVVLLLDFTKMKETVSPIITELLSVFAAIGWIKVFSQVIIDFITFLAFYFNIDEVILSSILLSAGNTIGDFFGNGALSAGGEEVMGAIASYSGQIFNNFVGFSASIVSGTLGGKTNFDIFGFDHYKDMAEGEVRAPPVGKYFLVAVTLVVLLVIALKFSLYAKSGYVLKKSFTGVLIPIYAVFFVCSLGFGFMRF